MQYSRTFCECNNKIVVHVPSKLRSTRLHKRLDPATPLTTAGLPQQQHFQHQTPQLF